MNVLLTNNNAEFVGGVERYVDILRGALPRSGMSVATLTSSKRDPDSHNLNEFTVRARDMSGRSPLENLKALYRWDLPRYLDRLVGEFRPDVVHLNLFDVHLTVALIRYFARIGTPLVQTVHDYRAVCPVATLHDGQSICTKCVGRIPFPILSSRCNRGSLVRSSFSFADAIVTRALGAYRSIDRFLPPSGFVAEALVAGGIPAEKVEVLPHAYPVEKSHPPMIQEPYILFAGRLHHTKGIRVLLQAAEHIPSVEIRVAGTGPEEALVTQALRDGRSNLRYLGFLEADELMRQVSRARCLVLPSIWHDNQPLSVIEAQSRGVPVVASRVGGLPEMIEDGVSGFLVAPGDSRQLAKRLHSVVRDARLARQLGEAGWRKAKRRYDVDRHVRRLVQIYGELQS